MPSNPKEDAQALVDCMLPFAVKMLKGHGGFLPFGGVIDLNNQVIHQGPSSGQKQPTCNELIDILRSNHKKAARENTIIASCSVYDVRVKSPEKGILQDTISMELDHKTDYSVIVHYPYIIAENNLTFEVPFASEGNYKIFL